MISKQHAVLEVIVVIVMVLGVVVVIVMVLQVVVVTGIILGVILNILSFFIGDKLIDKH